MAVVDEEFGDLPLDTRAERYASRRTNGLMGLFLFGIPAVAAIVAMSSGDLNWEVLAVYIGAVTAEYALIAIRPTHNFIQARFDNYRERERASYLRRHTIRPTQE